MSPEELPRSRVDHVNVHAEKGWWGGGGGGVDGRRLDLASRLPLLP